MKILDHKDAINHRQDEELIIVETAIYRVSCLNRTVLGSDFILKIRFWILDVKLFHIIKFICTSWAGETPTHNKCTIEYYAK
ncbi:MAG: hypothetical protein V7K67_00145 [Nostoc sp.]|uniref:hypothetical protein n=1 Tax=Nostoc sp. TaxID=1180 RepID=UPI002FEE6BBB